MPKEEEKAAEHTHAELDELKAALAACSERLKRLEEMAHTDHAIGKDTLDQIAQHATTHTIEQVNKHLGISGQPVR